MDKNKTNGLRKGIFWYINKSIVSVGVSCDTNGQVEEICEYSSKSGENFNHKAEWDKMSKTVTENKPYNYYPRGRVEIKNGNATVWLNPSLDREEIIEKIKKEFGLDTDKIRVIIKPDNSLHYRSGNEI